MNATERNIESEKVQTTIEKPLRLMYVKLFLYWQFENSEVQV